MPASLSVCGARSCALALTLAIGLSACGGSGSDGGDAGSPPGSSSGGPAPSASIDALIGDWQQKGCVTAGGQSFRKVLRATRTASATIDYYEGVRSYGSADCSGTSALAGPSKLGSVSFARSEANQQVAAHWGQFQTVTNTQFGAIWTLKSGGLLCLLGDEIPSNQPTLAAVSASLATVPESNCFNQ